MGPHCEIAVKRKEIAGTVKPHPLNQGAPFDTGLICCQLVCLNAGFEIRKQADRAVDDIVKFLFAHLIGVIDGARQKQNCQNNRQGKRHRHHSVDADRKTKKE
ncbi:hypothetical protein NIT7645_00310 [Phaeobacter italicus]|nr:hypothetical protein NIT7645_00310 [Phaeobacter italicus]